eukprot:2654606-Rhodomonas_salina.3
MDQAGVAQLLPLLVSQVSANALAMEYPVLTQNMVLPECCRTRDRHVLSPPLSCDAFASRRLVTDCCAPVRTTIRNMETQPGLTLSSLLFLSFCQTHSLYHSPSLSLFMMMRSFVCSLLSHRTHSHQQDPPFPFWEYLPAQLLQNIRH